MAQRSPASPLCPLAPSWTAFLQPCSPERDRPVPTSDRVPLSPFSRTGKANACRLLVASRPIQHTGQIRSLNTIRRRFRVNRGHRHFKVFQRSVLSQPQWQNGDSFKLAVWSAARRQGLWRSLGATQEALAGMADDLSDRVGQQEAQPLGFSNPRALRQYTRQRPTPPDG